jgi:hypothetical protein
MRGRVLHRASPDLNICCANISWVRFSKMCRARHISPPNIGKNEKPGAVIRPGTGIEGD